MFALLFLAFLLSNTYLSTLKVVFLPILIIVLSFSLICSVDLRKVFIRSFFLILKPIVFTDITLPSLDIRAKAFSNLSSLPFSITPILAA